MSLGLATVNENARSALDCGGSTPPWNNAEEEEQGGVEPPQSKVPSAHSFSKRRPPRGRAAKASKSKGKVQRQKSKMRDSLAVTVGIVRS